MNKEILLIFFMILFLAGAGYILYNNFYAEQNFVPNRGFGQISNNLSPTSVKILELQVRDKNLALDDEGIWFQLESDSRYRRLSNKATVPIVIGLTGQPSPFLPIIYKSPSDEQ